MSDEPIERAIISQLDRLKVPYELVPCDPEYADTAAFCERYGYPPDHSANTILVASKREPKHYAACVVLATTRLDVNKRVRKLMGVSKLSFASQEETREVTGMTLGGVTVFALPPAVPLYVDDRVMGLDYVILGGGSRSLKIKTSPVVFERMEEAEVVSDLALAPPGPAEG
ncbi:MAG: YbaK/EbsC family protein [Acidimicrobiia bacterium]